MIEQLKNCPNCGGILNEAGSCKFCGSKVYDFLNIDFSGHNLPSAKTYIRIRSGNKIYLTPIYVTNVSMSWFTKYEPTKINIECSSIGDLVVINDE